MQPQIRIRYHKNNRQIQLSSNTRGHFKYELFGLYVCVDMLQIAILFSFSRHILAISTYVFSH